MSLREVAAIAVGQTQYKRRYTELTYPELIFTAVTRALEDARATIDDVDAVILPMAVDALGGVAHAERWATDALGGGGKPVIRVNTGGVTGLTAVQVAHDFVASGAFNVVLIAGADRVGESGDAQSILNRIWDPIYERPLPLNTITMLAMQAVRFMEKYGATEVDMARVAVKNHTNGARNPYAHIRQEVTLDEVLLSRMIAYPIKLFDSCPQSSGAAAMILCAEDETYRFSNQPAWIRGLGHSSETYWMGDRMGPALDCDHADSIALTHACNQAYSAAGIRAGDLDIAELYAPFSNTELHAVQDAGLCEKGEAMKLLEEGYFDSDGEIPVNPSGGVMCANPISVTALVRVIEAVLQVQGRAGDHQVTGAEYALATGIGGDHQFFGAVVVSSIKACRKDIT